MRPIKFRAWVELDATREMMVVVGFEEKDDWTIPFSPTKPGRVIWWNVCTKEGSILSLAESTPPAHNTIRLMQFTGLLDKNGKEIYEGDILKSELGKISEVQWVNENIGVNGGEYGIGYVGWIADFYGDKSDCGLNEWNIEVIGNIYENPELLKEALND